MGRPVLEYLKQGEWHFFEDVQKLAMTTNRACLTCFQEVSECEECSERIFLVLGPYCATWLFGVCERAPGGVWKGWLGD